MEPTGPSAFTPFLRRFTDERSKDLRELITLYHELRHLHLGSAYANGDSLYTFGAEVYQTISERLPEELITPFAGSLSGVSALEQAIFEFPEIDFSRTQLSLKEQIDLQRFLTAKRHFLTNEKRVAPLLHEGLLEIFELLTEGLPALSGPSPFTIPLIHTLSEPKRRLDRLIGILWQQKFIDNGLFVELSNTLHRNLCRVSNITDFENAKGKPYKLPSAHDGPLDQIAEAYLQATPFERFLLSPVPLKLTHEDRFSHMHVLGGSGAGKTQLLQHLILHDLQTERPPSLVIVDSQGDLINKLSHLAMFDPDGGPLAERLILITPKDTRHPPAINIFDLNRDRLGEYDEAAREQVTAGVIQTFDYLFTGLLGADLTAKQSVFFRFVARLMLALPESMGRNATILDMIQLMEDPTPYRAAIESLPPIQRNFFERDFASKTFAQTKEQIRYRLNAILENPTLARLFTSTHTKIDFFEALNGGSIILVDTAKDFLKSASGHFGRIFISLVLQAVLERSVIAEDERTPTFLIVDEAAAYFDSNIDDLLTEARKYKCGCVFAHQFLDQATPSLRASLAANTSIKMASGVSTGDARALAPELRTTADFILSQPRLQFASYIRNVTWNAVSIPVTAGALEGQPILSKHAYECLRQKNRERVCRTDPPPRREAPPSNKDPQAPAEATDPADSDPTAASEDW